MGNVFLANTTGDVVSLGFALAGAPGFRAWTSILSLGASGAGAHMGGRITRRHSDRRGGRICIAALVHLAITTAAVMVASPAPPRSAPCRNSRQSSCWVRGRGRRTLSSAGWASRISGPPA
ncbi:DUF1275 family protein [Streptomyces spongiae]|uniref:DUF1275 domain-containing protein n=1 Tax=Streptomyces spongiae TaxID=565072 RepID=A0A5N8XBJ4_9ACTN|nr:DUF1275 domain-containing protein [Streptomyces spongiae]